MEYASGKYILKSEKSNAKFRVLALTNAQNRTPSTIPPTVVKSGRSWWSKSINEPAIINDIQIHQTSRMKIPPM